MNSQNTQLIFRLRLVFLFFLLKQTTHTHAVVHKKVTLNSNNAMAVCNENSFAKSQSQPVSICAKY